MRCVVSCMQLFVSLLWGCCQGLAHLCRPVAGRGWPGAGRGAVVEALRRVLARPADH